VQQPCWAWLLKENGSNTASSGIFIIRSVTNALQHSEAWRKA
jgi:hypothetical protein